jgi:transposase
MVAISLDLRKRIVYALRTEPSSLRVAARFDVSPSFVRKLRIRERKTGDIRARRGPGRGRLVKGDTDLVLRELVRAHRDATLIELGRLLRKAMRVTVMRNGHWARPSTRNHYVKKDTLCGRAQSA